MLIFQPPPGNSASLFTTLSTFSMFGNVQAVQSQVYLHSTLLRLTAGSRMLPLYRTERALREIMALSLPPKQTSNLEFDVWKACRMPYDFLFLV